MFCSHTIKIFLKPWGNVQVSFKNTFGQNLQSVGKKVLIKSYLGQVGLLVIFVAIILIINWCGRMQTSVADSIS